MLSRDISDTRLVRDCCSSSGSSMMRKDPEMCVKNVVVTIVKSAARAIQFERRRKLIDSTKSEWNSEIWDTNTRPRSVQESITRASWKSDRNAQAPTARIKCVRWSGRLEVGVFVHGSGFGGCKFDR